MHGAAFESRDACGLTTGLENRNISVGNKAPLLERVSNDKIGGRTEATHREFFPFQVLRFLDLGRSNNTEIDDINQTSENHRIGALQPRNYRRLAANNRNGQIACNKSLNDPASSRDKDETYIKPIFLKNARILNNAENCLRTRDR